jgi:hypothetical protein
MALPVIITLPIDAAPQAGLSKYLLVNLSLLTEFHLLLKDIDLARQNG